VVQAFPRYKQLIAELHDQVRRIAANIANELLAGQSHHPACGACHSS
jgi:hypothetical protein